jgi:hypothetical protein
MKGLSTKKITKQIDLLQREKDIHINNLLILKSAFSIIDDMFIKEMENAEIKKKIWIRRWVCCGFNVDEKVVDPRKISTFIEDVMDPYGRQDKIIKELKEKEEILKKEKEKEDKKLEKKCKTEDEKFKKVWDAVTKTKSLLKDNVILIEKLYDKLEKGEIKCNKDKESTAFTLKKIPNIVKLFGDKNEKPNFDNIILSVEDIKEIDSDEIKSIRSDSSNSLDCVIECETRKK